MKSARLFKSLLKLLYLFAGCNWQWWWGGVAVFRNFSGPLPLSIHFITRILINILTKSFTMKLSYETSITFVFRWWGFSSFWRTKMMWIVILRWHGLHWSWGLETENNEKLKKKLNQDRDLDLDKIKIEPNQTQPIPLIGWTSEYFDQRFDQ